MPTVTSREMIHNFSRVAARVVAGEELTVTRHGIPLLRLAPVAPANSDALQRQTLVQKALAVRMSRPFGTSFARGEAYEE